MVLLPLTRGLENTYLLLRSSKKDKISCWFSFSFSFSFVSPLQLELFGLFDSVTTWKANAMLTFLHFTKPTTPPSEPRPSQTGNCRYVLRSKPRQLPNPALILSFPIYSGDFMGLVLDMTGTASKLTKCVCGFLSGLAVWRWVVMILVSFCLQ